MTACGACGTLVNSREAGLAGGANRVRVSLSRFSLRLDWFTLFGITLIISSITLTALGSDLVTVTA